MLSDGSAPPWSGTFDSQSSNGNATAVLNFAAASEGQTLTVTYQVTVSHSADGQGNATLAAATLA